VKVDIQPQVTFENLLMADPIAGIQKLSPRVRLAARLYATGLANKKQASEAAGLHPAYFGMLSNRNGHMQNLLAQLDQELMSDTVDMNKALTRLSRIAVGRIAGLMDSDKQDIALKAAIDLADRGPETQKVQRLEIASFTMDGKDVEALAAALVESARTKAEYMDVALNGLVEVQDVQEQLSNQQAEAASAASKAEAADDSPT
jgi:hypothetical protein